ncbi:MAG: hypothetical protein OJF58_000127 [Enhydrobacter sp.]|nr:MAG: hypothetical protein OJF58_000127 [Enhydrobacter sp.]
MKNIENIDGARGKVRTPMAPSLRHSRPPRHTALHGGASPLRLATTGITGG